MRLVLDTAVIVAGLRSSSGASRRLLVAALHRRFTLLLSVRLFVEYEAVLMRSEHLKASGLTSVEMAQLLDSVAAVAEPVVPAFRWRPMLKDANDDMVFEAALNGGADLLVTINKRDFEGVRGANIRVVSPGEALRILGDSI